MPKRKTLSDKLSEVDSFLDTGKFNEDDYVKLYRRYIPTSKRTSWLLDTIENSSPNMFWQTDLAKQTILAIALSKHNEHRAEEAEKILALVKEISPSSVEKANYKVFQELYTAELKDIKGEPFISDKRRSQKLWWAWDTDFNWYENHTLKEIEQAIQVDVKTIREAVPKPKGRTRSGKAINTLLYSPDECLEILKWWLDDYLRPKIKRWPVVTKRKFIKDTGRMILNNIKFGNHNLSDAEMDKVRKIVLDTCGLEAEPYSSVFDAREK